MATMQAVLGLETGRIINEHYTLTEYINRRAGFLGIHPDHARMPTGLFAIARLDAKEVFESDHALSVQEVRRRELSRDVDPLLPLPTTENTQSLDKFQSYPDREWSPGVSWPVQWEPSNDSEPEARLTPTPPSALISNSQTNAMSRKTGSPLIAQRDLLRATSLPSIRTQTSAAPDTPGPSYFSMPPSSSQERPRSELSASQKAMTHSANNGETVLSSEQRITSQLSRHSQNRNRDQSSNFDQPSSSPPAEMTSTQATTPLLMGSTKDDSHRTGLSQQALLRGITDRLGTPYAQIPTSSQVQVDSSISALAGRGFSLPVKQRGTKRAASESPEATDSVLGSQVDDETPTSEQSPTKRIKLIKPRGAAATDDTRSAKEKNKKKADKFSKQSGPTSKPRDPLEAVVSGRAIARTKAQAEQASKLRRQRLLNEHNADQAQSGKNTSRAGLARKKPDLMPEFFDRDDFAAGQEDDSVRCVCGGLEDDNERFVQCSDCSVWQHIACVGEAKSSNPKDDYWCHVCDPWAHRKIIQRLRKEQPLS